MKKSKAFTLSELMVALAVLGIICAIVLPAITNNNPNRNKMMMKKAYNVFTDTINELVNDDGHYPVVYGLCPDNGESGYVGLDCAENDSKLPYLFSKQLATSRPGIDEEDTLKTDATYSRSGLAACNGADNSCYFLKSEDGMTWAFSKKKFTKGDYSSNIIVGIDVNGDKKPNCYEGSNASNCQNRDGNFDQFRLELYADGKIKIDPDDEWATEAIYASSSLSE